MSAVRSLLVGLLLVEMEERTRERIRVSIHPVSLPKCDSVHYVVSTPGGKPEVSAVYLRWDDIVGEDPTLVWKSYSDTKSGFVGCTDWRSSREYVANLLGSLEGEERKASESSESDEDTLDYLIETRDTFEGLVQAIGKLASYEPVRFEACRRYLWKSWFAFKKASSKAVENGSFFSEEFKREHGLGR